MTTTAEQLEALEPFALVIDPLVSLTRGDKSPLYMWLCHEAGDVYGATDNTALAIREKQAREYIWPRVERFSLGLGHDKMVHVVCEATDAELDHWEADYDTPAEALAATVEFLAEEEANKAPEADA